MNKTFTGKKTLKNIVADQKIAKPVKNRQEKEIVFTLRPSHLTQT